jgi:hypothetical protein
LLFSLVSRPGRPLVQFLLLISLSMSVNQENMPPNIVCWTTHLSRREMIFSSQFEAAIVPTRSQIQSLTQAKYFRSVSDSGLNASSNSLSNRLTCRRLYCGCHFLFRVIITSPSSHTIQKRSRENAFEEEGQDNEANCHQCRQIRKPLFSTV